MDSDAEKIKSSEEISEHLDNLRKGGKKVVWTNGCFDIIHAGHISYLKTAKSFGDSLVVGLNSDSSVKKIKGDGRPINNQDDRAAVLAGMEAVNLISIFEDTNFAKVLSSLKPDIYVKGGDYTLETMNQEERKAIESYGGKIVFANLVQGKSTTKTIEKVRSG